MKLGTKFWCATPIAPVPTLQQLNDWVIEHNEKCGKGLTDPVSMARWIGPECWGSASTNIPRLFKAEAA